MPLTLLSLRRQKHRNVNVKKKEVKVKEIKLSKCFANQVPKDFIGIEYC